MLEETGQGRSLQGSRAVGDGDEVVATVDEFTTEVALLFLRMRHAAEQYLHQGPLSAARRSVLRGLARRGPQTVPQMARERAVSRQHIQRLVNDLADEGLLRLTDNPAHKRSHLVEATAAGRKRVREIERREEKLFRWLGSELSIKELKAAAATLRKVRSRLQGGGWRQAVEKALHQPD